MRCSAGSGKRGRKFTILGNKEKSLPGVGEERVR
jgi:hypothetical protein